MHGRFFTDRDIADLIQQGIKSLELGPEDRITDIARERAVAAGLALIRKEIPRASATIGSAGKVDPLERKDAPPTSASLGSAGRVDLLERGGPDLAARVRASVIGKLGEPVDSALLDRIIRRVLDQLGKG